MRITWLGHSCFKIENEGTTIILDPYEDGSVAGYGNIREKADLVLCTHEHGDHNGRGTVELTGNSAADVKITKIDTYHDHHRGEHRGKNTIYILEMGGYRIAHLGDLGCQLPKEQMDMLKNLDLLLIPVGGHFTIDAREAADLAKELAPVTTVPMHYRDDEKGFGYDVIGTADEFTRRMDSVAVLNTSVLLMEDRPKERVAVLVPANLE